MCNKEFSIFQTGVGRIITHSSILQGLCPGLKVYYLRSIPLGRFDFLVEEILAFHRNVIRFL
jgi:hypothetical protein